MSGSSKLLFPRAKDALQAVYLNSSGGVTGGDAFEIEARAQENAHLVMTTQAAERIYRALPGETGRVDTRLTLEPGARLALRGARRRLQRLRRAIEMPGAMPADIDLDARACGRLATDAGRRLRIRHGLGAHGRQLGRARQELHGPGVHHAGDVVVVR